MPAVSKQHVNPLSPASPGLWLPATAGRHRVQQHRAPAGPHTNARRALAGGERTVTLWSNYDASVTSDHRRPACSACKRKHLPLSLSAKLQGRCLFQLYLTLSMPSQLPPPPPPPGRRPAAQLAAAVPPRDPPAADAAAAAGAGGAPARRRRPAVRCAAAGCWHKASPTMHTAQGMQLSVLSVAAGAKSLFTLLDSFQVM